MLPTENWRVDFDGHSPIYQQIIMNFSRAIATEELKPGDRIPSIRDLAVALKVNTNTIQRAYQEMERDKLIYTQRGTGYFIMENEEITVKVKQVMINQAMSQFLEEMRALGYSDTQIVAELQQKLKQGGAS
ncbi:MAG: GntR family transcriptional regulator [Oscillospiraceae bacterium]|nr:GntR family transcriptional regulator [Oscillospiraceae bacterium]